MALTQRQKRYVAALALTLALVTVVAAAWGWMMNGHQYVRPSFSLMLSAALAGLGLLACVPWWRALDEMQRSAQLTSWYWGGSFGCVAGLLGAGLIGGVHSALLSGALLVAAAQIISFAVCWTVSRFIHRPAAS